MKTRLAWHNLAHSKVRSATALAGVMFAVVLIFLQLGFLRATERAASLVYEALDFDLVIRSRQARRISQSPPLLRTRLDHAATAPFVGGVYPVHVAFNRWRIPTGPTAGYGRRILTLGVKPGDPVFRDAELQAAAARLTEPQFALIDRLARGRFRPGQRPPLQRRGRWPRQRSRPSARAADWPLFAGGEFRRRWLDCRQRRGLSPALSGLGQRSGERGPGAASRRRRRGLGRRGVGRADARRRRSVDPEEVIARERHIWLWEMSIGLVFVMGVGVALVVGTAIVYQILSSDVTSHLSEYATLKAMGYRNGFLGRVVIEQAVILSVCGFVPALLVALGLYEITRLATNIPIDITPLRVVLVGVLSVGMCIVSGLIALRKLRAAEPADLFR